MREDKGRVGRKKVKGGNYVTTVVMYKIPLKLKKNQNNVLNCKILSVSSV